MEYLLGKDLKNKQTNKQKKSVLNVDKAKKTTYEWNGYINKEKKPEKETKEISELKNKITAMKSTLKGVKRVFELAEESVNLKTE